MAELKTPFSEIPKFVIHLPERTDRVANMTKEMDFFCGKDNYTVWEGKKHQRGCIGIAESFQSILKHAKQNKYPSVLICEDDVRFTTSKAHEIWQKGYEQLPKDWHLYLAGVYFFQFFNKLPNTYSPNLYKVNNFSSLHCGLWSERIYDHILIWTNKGYDIDAYISKLWNLNKFILTPFVALQYSGISDNTTKYRELEKELKHYKVAYD